MNASAIEKIAEGEKTQAANATSGSGSGASLAPWAGALGTAVLAHLMQRPDKDEEETTMDKVRRWLVSIGAGAGAYYIGDRVVKGMDPDARRAAEKARQEAFGDTVANGFRRAGAGAAHLGGAAFEVGAARDFLDWARNGFRLPSGGLKGSVSRFFRGRPDMVTVSGGRPHVIRGNIGTGTKLGLGALLHSLGSGLNSWADYVAVENELKRQKLGMD